MRTVLHVGTHKTGTTSIQIFANRNARQLRQRGLWYPGYDLIGLGDHPRLKRHPAHHDFTHVLGQSRCYMTLEQANDFVAAIAKGAKDDETVLLSAEPAYRHLIKPKEGEVGDYWSQREAYVARLAETMAPLKPEIFIVLRRQDDFSRSLYQENIKSKHLKKNFREFLKSYIQFFQYLEQITLFKKYFDIVDIAIFEDLAKDRELVRDFFAHIGVDVSQIDKVPDLNESLSMELVEYKRHLSMSGVPHPQLAALNRILMDVGKDSERFPRSSDLDWIPAAEMEEFMGQFAAGNAQVHAMMKNPPARATLFPEGRPRTEVFGGLSLQRFKAINASVMMKLLPHVGA